MKRPDGREKNNRGNERRGNFGASQVKCLDMREK
jgi:hypothetical protein